MKIRIPGILADERREVMRERKEKEQKEINIKKDFQIKIGMDPIGQPLCQDFPIMSFWISLGTQEILL